MSPLRRRTHRHSIALTLLLGLMMSLSGCASGPRLVGQHTPSAVTPCVRPKIGGLWTCIRVKQLVWLQGSKQRSRAWLGPRVGR
jgi:hypothetical protein